MSNKERNRSLLIASAIVVAFASAILLLFHPSRSPLGSFFDVFIVLMVTHYMALTFGGIVLLLRVVKVIRNNASVTYLLAGVLNVFLAVVGVTLFFTDNANLEWLHKSIANLFIGFLIFTDAFFLTEKIKE